MLFLVGVIMTEIEFEETHNRINQLMIMARNKKQGVAYSELEELLCTLELCEHLSVEKMAQVSFLESKLHSIVATGDLLSRGDSCGDQ